MARAASVVSDCRLMWIRSAIKQRKHLARSRVACDEPIQCFGLGSLRHDQSSAGASRGAGHQQTVRRIGTETQGQRDHPNELTNAGMATCHDRESSLAHRARATALSPVLPATRPPERNIRTAAEPAAAPGASSHPCDTRAKYCRASISMLPQLGTGSLMPSPRNESVTSARMNCGISTVACVRATPRSPAECAGGSDKDRTLRSLARPAHTRVPERSAQPNG